MTETIYYKKTYTYRHVLPEMMRHTCQQLAYDYKEFIKTRKNLPNHVAQALNTVMDDCVEDIQRNYEQIIGYIDLNKCDSTEQLLQKATCDAFDLIHTGIVRLQQALWDTTEQVDTSNRPECRKTVDAVEGYVLGKWRTSYIHRTLQSAYDNVTKLNDLSDYNLETWLTMLFGAWANMYDKLIYSSVREQLTATVNEHYAAYNDDDESHEDYIQAVIRYTLDDLPLEQLIRDRADLVLEDGTAKQKFLAGLPQAVQELREREENCYSTYLWLVEQLYDKKDRELARYNQLYDGHDPDEEYERMRDNLFYDNWH